MSFRQLARPNYRSTASSVKRVPTRNEINASIESQFVRTDGVMRSRSAGATYILCMGEGDNSEQRKEARSTVSGSGAQMMWASISLREEARQSIAAHIAPLVFDGYCSRPAELTVINFLELSADICLDNHT